MRNYVNAHLKEEDRVAVERVPDPTNPQHAYRLDFPRLVVWMSREKLVGLREDIDRALEDEAVVVGAGGSMSTTDAPATATVQ